MKRALEILGEANKPNKIVARDTVVFSKLMDLLDHPHRSFKSVHVTGTNGKGSVTLKMATILEKAGYRVGMYTSPHLFSFLERIQINRANISQDYFASRIEMLNKLANTHALPLTFFEYLTATAFLYFRDEKCQFASIEVGLGGRHDTTNVIDPVLSIITSIGLDHTRILGSTVEEIAKDKAGIIKPNRPVIVGPNAQFQCILEQAREKKAEVVKVFSQSNSDFEEENNEITKKAVKKLEECFVTIPPSSIAQGLEARAPCRMEELPDELYPASFKGLRIFFDVGHNPAAIGRMLQSYKKKRLSSKDILVVVFGCSKDKEAFNELVLIEKVAAMVFLVEANHSRALSINELSKHVPYLDHPRKFRVIDKGKIKSTLQIVTSLEEQRCDIIICGSFFLMPEAWGFFDNRYYNMDTNINENYELKSINKS